MKAVLITSSILIVLLAALRPLLRGKIDPRVQYALWLAVVLRLLIPVNFVDSAYSALALLDRAEEPAQLVETIGQASIPAQSYDSARAQVVEEYQRQGVKEANLTPTDLMDIDRQARELMKGPTLAELAAKYARPVWLGGAAAMGLWFLLVNLGLRRKLRRVLPVEADCPLPVYVTPELPSPCLCGVVRPTIYVTPAALESPERLRHVLAHELTHRRHRDHLWALVRCLCLCVYWFDPLVWWAAALSRQDGELACDEGTIRRLGEGERLPYGRTLVDMIAAGRTPLLQTATTMTGGKRRVRERIKLIARRPKTVIAVALALALILGLAVGCTFTGAPGEPREPQKLREPITAQTPEPVASDPLTADTLQERLGNIPEDLRDRVRFEIFHQDSGLVAEYWYDIPDEWVDEDNWGNFVLSVYQWDSANVKYQSGLDENCHIFARTENHYYAIVWYEDGQYAGYNEYWDAVEAIHNFAMRTVLDTEGVWYLENPQLPPAPWEADPTQFILDNLDAAFSNGVLAVRVFFNNGSGPASTAVMDSESGQKVRELFSSYDWEVTQQSWAENTPFVSFAVDFHDWDAPYGITINTYSDMLYMSPIDLSIDNRPCFRADGAENLSRDIAALLPDPRAQCAFVSCPAQETREGTARLFMDDFFAVMLENGHITDYELGRLDVLREDPDYPSMITFNVRFRLKAAHPELAFWKEAWLHYISVDESGWTNTIKWKMYLHTDEEGGVYTLDWIS